ncbi:MAG: amidohydrolase [Proteobacteria bacterium]|nr:amidohydrolase [Pseudomonadota bacterium]
MGAPFSWTLGCRYTPLRGDGLGRVSARRPGAGSRHDSESPRRPGPRLPQDDADWLIEQAGDDVFMFASDYPHPEGGRDPLGRFERCMADAGTSPEAMDRFYSGNFEALMGPALPR